MFGSKLKLSAILTLAAAFFILTQTLFNASAQAESAAQTDLNPPAWFDAARAFFDFRRHDSEKLAPASCAAPPSGLVSWYRAENNANDVLNANNGTMQNGATLAAGKVGQALSFDGVDDFIQLPNNASLNPSSIAVEGWINPQQTALGTIYVARDPFSSEGFSVAVDSDGSLAVNIRTINNPNSSPSFVSTAPNTIQFNQWQHVAITYDESGGTLAAYINGVNTALNGTVVLGGAIRPAASHFIGQRQSQNPDPRNFKGLIDELSIYSRALSPTEIQSIFTAGSAGKCVSTICTPPPVNQVSWWRGENSGGDSQGANNGVLQDNATFTTGIVGQAFRFASANAKFTVPPSSSLNVGAGGELTFEAWVKLLSISGNSELNGPIFEWNQGQGLHLFRSADGGFYVNLAATDASIAAYQTGGGFLNVSQFSHVAFTYSRTTGFAKIFVNGVEIDSRNFGSHSLRTTGEMSLGARGQENYNVNAVIDEPAIYNRALSQTEIQAIFNAGSAGKCLPSVPLQISPTTTNVLTGATQNFTATGGNAPYTFSILTNNSGGSVNSSTGVYTAGTITGTDTIRVTDANNATANATVNVSTVAARLVFTVQPSDAVGGQNISPAIRVAVQDNFGNPINDSNAAITLAILNNPNNGTLSGTVVKNAVNGIAIFSDLSIDNSGSGYILSATSAGLSSAASNAFNITSSFEVTNTNDAGAGSLRQAILNANSTAGMQTITFNITGNAPFTIKPTFELPRINDRAIIDGTTQPGFSGAPIIELDGEFGSRAGTTTPGIGINAAFSVVKGLIINNWNIGIKTNAVAVEVKGNYIGTDISGLVAKPNGIGISILQGYAVIGGINAADRNVISGNTSAGIVRDSLDFSVVSSIDGNFIGTKADGFSPLPNGTGILVAGRRVLIGSNAPNVIAFNVQHGIEINSNNNSNLVGEANIAVNSIFSNGGRGIKIGRGFTPTVNDPLDTDAGDNAIQNFPVITSATSANGFTTIRGTLNSEPSKLYFVRFFSNQACDSSGYGEGENFIGITNFSTDASGIKSFTATFTTPVAVGSSITATATVFPGITSEFSRCLTVAGNAHSISGQITDTGNVPMPNVAVKVQGTSLSTLTDSNGVYSFVNLPDGFNYTIAPTAPSVNFAPANRTITNLSADQPNQNFTGTRLARVSGQITSVINGASFAIGGATVTLSGATGTTANTDINGRYVFNNVAPGNYTAVPSKTGFAFNPPSVSLTVTGDRTADFSSFLTAGLSGRILKSYIGFEAINADGGNEVYLLNGLGGFATGCLRFPCQVAFEAKLSPDGGKIAFIESTKNQSQFTPINKRLFVANFDGSNKQLVYTFPASDTNPIDYLGWSPDGAKFAFTRSQRSLRIINIDGTNETVVLPETTNSAFSTPEWSPDGAKILFNGTEVVNINGTNRVRLTSGAIDDNAKWSPDGSKIAFIRRPALNSTGRIFTMNADGSTQTALTTDSDYINVLWSPDGAKLAFTKRGDLPTENFYGVMNPTGANLQIIRSIAGNILSWSPIFAPETPTGANVSTSVGSAAVTFANVSNAGTTTITPIPSYSAGSAPNGFNFGGQTYEITTTATISAPITVCFTAPAEITESRFNRLSVLHRENGVFVDRTTSRDFPTRKICASANSLSPFAVAEQIDDDLPNIAGLVQDADGKLLVNIPVYLTGAETADTTTDSDGFFKFVNLMADANYNVQPKRIGYLFNENNQDFVNLTGENAVIFEGISSIFSIGGKVSDDNGNGVSGVNINLEGAAQAISATNANGVYIFNNLPADGFYTLKASNGTNNFSPSTAVISPLTNDENAVDFQTFAPTAAGVSVSGRVVLPPDLGLQNAIVTLTDSRGNSRTILTGKFGKFRFTDIAAGETYIVSVSAKRHIFAPQIINITADITGLIFTADSSKE